MNNNCIDFDLSQVSSIRAYKTSDVNLSFPVYAYRNVISNAVIWNWGNGQQVSFVKDSVSVSDTESKTVAGNLHTVKVSWEMRCVTPEDYAALAHLRHSAHYLVITCFGNIKRLVATGVSGYDFSCEESDGKRKCTMVLRNGQGIMSVQ